ncbi:metallophosphoesterase [Leucobacter sp. W1153]|uniref:metallophosphoesterase n=1 Tax=Leucobacter sp. W1153 TaxID=3439064 RepID=UPI003F2AC828
MTCRRAGGSDTHLRTRQPAGGGGSKAVAAIGLAVGSVALWATAVEPQLFTLRRHSVALLPAGHAPLRVLQLSDLHLAPWQHRKIGWVRSLAELRPDLVVLTGDQMGHRSARKPLLHALQTFAEAGIPGVFVHGSNDYYSPVIKNPLNYLREPSRKGSRRPDIDTAALTRGLTDDLGFSDLNNAATKLILRGTSLEIFGLGDPHIRYNDAVKMRESLAAARSESSTAADEASSGSPNHPPRLGVVHAPYQGALNDLLDVGADFIFAGHTHGGQVRVPGVGALTANCDLPTEQARGLSVWYDAERAAFLNVSAGLGASIYAPIRFACRPEASLITLEAVRD